MRASAEMVMTNHKGLLASQSSSQHTKFYKEDALNCFLDMFIEETPSVIHDYIMPQTSKESAGFMYESYSCAD